MGCARRLCLLTWLVLLALPGLASAAVLELPSPAGPVTDLAGILDSGTKERLVEVILDVRQRTTAEIAILTVPTTAPEAIEDYSVAIFDRWKIGERGKRRSWKRSPAATPQKFCRFGPISTRCSTGSDSHPASALRGPKDTRLQPAIEPGETPPVV